MLKDVATKVNAIESNPTAETVPFDMVQPGNEHLYPAKNYTDQMASADFDDKARFSVICMSIFCNRLRDALAKAGVQNIGHIVKVLRAKGELQEDVFK